MKGEKQMKAKLLINDKEIEVEISDKEFEGLSQSNKKTGYERVPLNEEYYREDCLNVMYAIDIYDVADNDMFDGANYYSDSDVAKNNTRADKLMRQLRRFAVVHRNNKMDWVDYSQVKYNIYYDYDRNDLSITSSVAIRDFGSIYFDSKETAQLAIETFHDELIWYFTEYKDSL